jgi:Ca2+-binding EF-hand superfamily protein
MSVSAKARLKARFDLLDVNGNGYIEENDFEDLARRLIDAFGEPKTSPKAKAVLKSHVGYWRGLVETLDLNRDGRVSEEEFLQGVHGAAEFDHHVHGYMTSMAALADRDDDGFAERADFVTSLRVIGFAPDRIDAVFDALDPSGTGRVRTSAWVEMVKDFYVTEQPSGAAALLVAA